MTIVLIFRVESNYMCDAMSVGLSHSCWSIVVGNVGDVERLGMSMKELVRLRLLCLLDDKFQCEIRHCALSGLRYYCFGGIVTSKRSLEHYFFA